MTIEQQKEKAQVILEKHCPSMSDLYLDEGGRNFRDRVVNAMIEYRLETGCIHTPENGGDYWRCSRCGERLSD